MSCHFAVCFLYVLYFVLHFQYYCHLLCLVDFFVVKHLNSSHFLLCIFIAIFFGVTVGLHDAVSRSSKQRSEHRYLEGEVLFAYPGSCKLLLR